MRKGKNMSTNAADFDDKIANWKREMELPWGKLKYRLGQSNLAKHLGRRQMNILDAGGGNGLDSIPFAKQGHFIDIVDYSREMLADVQHRALEEGVQDYITTRLADIRNVSDYFPPSQFDLVLCHNILQYMEDVPALLGNLSSLLRPGGVISVISINRYSTPYQAAFLDGDLTKALLQLDTRISTARIFGAVMTSYSAEEMKELLVRAGLAPEGEYGIRCICDYWGDNERKMNPAIFEQMEQLEFALTDLYPYKLLARYFQIVARKPENAGAA
jgi:S-adenosylmethionine-dependent methyltransferase